MARTVLEHTPPRQSCLRPEEISARDALSRGFEWLTARTTDERLIVLLSSVISVCAYIWYSSHGLTFAYADALSRMEIARRVLISRTPGLAQLGTTWLPLQPMLMLPLIWNNTLFHDGFAGSFPSMVAYVIASPYIYRIARFLFSARGAAWVAAAAFMLNPSVIYMQATAMSEVPMICTAVVAIYYMLVWAKSYHPADLIKSAAAVAAGTAIRYDGWALAVALAVVVFYLARRHRGMKGVQGSGLLYGTLAFSGCAAWVIYNLVIFHDPVLFVFFGNSNNSIDLAAKPSYLHAWLSLEMYSYASGAMVGWVTAALAVIGLIAFVVRYRLKASMLPVYALLVPFVYYWLTFFLGFDSINLPQLGLGTYWNARFGLQLVPVMAFLLGYLATRRRGLLIALLGVVVWFGTTTARAPFALQDAVASFGLSSKAPGQWLVNEYHGGNVLVSYGPDAPMMFYMMQHIPDDNFITDSDGRQYRYALKFPQRSVRWVIMDENDSGNPIWAALHNRKVFHEYFALRKVLGTTMFYGRIADSGTGVGREPTTGTPARAQAG